jgi:uncharacterized RDD family membrane protein YckC
MHCSSCGASVTEGTAFCGSCGRPIVGFRIAPPSPGAAAARRTAGPSGMLAVSTTNYAGFWLRFVAALIDGILLGIPLSILALIVIAGSLSTIRHTRDPMTIMMTVLPQLGFIAIVYLLASWLYWGLMESSAWQATLGKKALGLYVTDLEGNRPTFGRVSGRFFAGRGISIVPSIGGLYYLVDCIMVGFTEKKQALHDMIASCLVLRNT